MGNHRYDAVVVGAGLAGSSCAYVLANNNASVALIERGERPGSKNMFGGSLYVEPVQEIFPAFWKEAPLERAIVGEELWLLDVDSVVRMGFTGFRFKKEPFNSFSVIRSKFDQWLAGKAVEAGCDLMTSTLVTDLVYEKTGLTGKKVNGVLLDSGDTIRADVVVLAEGVQADLVQKAGLRKKIKPENLTHYVKEIIQLDSSKIEERFGLEPGEGAVIGLIGFPTSGAIGKGGIWTNKDSISITVGGYLSQLIEKGLNPYQLLQRTKEHPLIKRLIEGGKTVQYLSHCIPKGGYKAMPRLYDDGVLVVGDAAVMTTGRRGADLAMLSGKYAAEAVLQAKAKGYFTGEVLESYQSKINNTFFMKTIKMGGQDKLKYYLEREDADYLLSTTINKIAYEMFTYDMKSMDEKKKKIMEIIKMTQPTFKTISDVIEGIQHWEGGFLWEM